MRPYCWLGYNLSTVALTGGQISYVDFDESGEGSGLVHLYTDHASELGHTVRDTDGGAMSTVTLTVPAECDGGQDSMKRNASSADMLQY